MSFLGKSLKFSSDVFGGGFLRDALNPGTLTNDKDVQRQVDLLNQAKARTLFANAKALALQRKSIPLVRKQYADANANNLALATQSKRDLLDTVPGQDVGVRRSLEGSGMGSSNLVQLGERGV